MCTNRKSVLIDRLLCDLWCIHIHVTEFNVDAEQNVANFMSKSAPFQNRESDWGDFREGSLLGGVQAADPRGAGGRAADGDVGGGRLLSCAWQPVEIEIP